MIVALESRDGSSGCLGDRHQIIHVASVWIVQKQGQCRNGLGCLKPLQGSDDNDAEGWILIGQAPDQRCNGSPVTGFRQCPGNTEIDLLVAQPRDENRNSSRLMQGPEDANGIISIRRNLPFQVVSLSPLAGRIGVVSACQNR